MRSPNQSQRSTSNEVMNIITEQRQKHNTPSNRQSNHQSSRLSKFFKTPKGRLLCIFFVLFIVAECYQSPMIGLLHLLQAVIPAVIIDVLIGMYQKRKRLFPDSAILTATIVALVLSTSLPWFETVFTTVVAVGSKHLIVSNRKPLLNPAAIGLVIAILLFSSGQSWWGGLALAPPYFIVLLLIAGFYITDKVNKFPLMLTFLGLYFLLFAVYGLVGNQIIHDIFLAPFVNSTLFFGFFMATDPPTSPAKYKDQIIFGALIAVISFVLYILYGGLAYLLIGLLLANAWKFIHSKMQQKKKQGSRKHQRAHQVTTSK